MPPYREILRTYRQSYSISIIPDYPNAFTCQYVVTNDTSRDPIHGPVTEVQNFVLSPLSNLLFGQYKCNQKSTHLYSIPVFKLNAKLLLNLRRLDTPHHLLPHSSASSLPFFVLHIYGLWCHNRLHKALHFTFLSLLTILDRWVYIWSYACLVVRWG